MKKLFALLLALALVFTLVACAGPAAPSVPGPGSNSNNPGNSIPSEIPIDTVSVEFPLAEKQKLTISMNANSASDIQRQLDTNQFWQDILELTNLEIVIQTYTLDNVAAMFQTGKMGDVVMCGGSGNDTLFQGFISQDQLEPLDAYIRSEAVMPNLHKYIFADHPEVEAAWTAPDGHIYIPGRHNTNKSASMESYMWINKTWLDKAGMGVPETWEEFEDALYYFGSHDMNGNGKDDEVPLFATTGHHIGIDWLLGLWGVPTKDGQYENYTYLKDGQVYFAPQMEVYKDYIKTMNRWYEDGILYQYLFTDAGAGVYSSTASGDVRVGVIAIDDLALVRGADQYVLMTPVQAPEAVDDVRWYIHPSYMGDQNIFCVTRGSEKTKLACAFMDLFYNPDNGLRYLYGEENSIWRQENADGTVTPIVPDPSLATDVKYTENNCFQLITWGDMTFPFAKTEAFYEKVHLSDAQQTEADQFKVYEDAGVINDEVWPRPFFTLKGSETILEIRADLFSLVNMKRAAWITGKEDVEADWEEYLLDLNAGDVVDDFVDVMQEAYDAWKANLDKILARAEG